MAPTGYSQRPSLEDLCETGADDDSVFTPSEHPTIVRLSLPGDLLPPFIPVFERKVALELEVKWPSHRTLSYAMASHSRSRSASSSSSSDDDASFDNFAAASGRAILRRIGRAPKQLDPQMENTTPSCCHGPDAQNLVVCLDGTANQFSVKNTNIVELYGSLDKSKSQRTYYNTGIGTYAKPTWWSPKYLWQLTDNMIDMMFTWYVTGALFYV
ncbi:hypothetical protein HGRIS_003285 [Hohenbuehelia grisea]|uniref:T6SS Phospholipase effector Tle1-like catalytic domain-containing protein n=1 Tax=Hohenbuehelia grisea TaxID=104357 RepID=A0ABR3JP87_9AGAR